MSEIRTFIAIPLPEKVKKELGRVKELLDPFSDGVKWTDEDNLHITMKFLGETPDWMMEDVKKEFKRICSGIDSFEIQLQQLGQFPKEGDPRILWAGLQKIPPVVYGLSDEFNAGYMALGFDDSGKKFAPHITLARVKRRIHEDLIPSFYDIQIESLVFKIDKIVLYESTHKRGALKYVPIEEYSLK